MIKFRGIPISGYKTDETDFDGKFVYGNYVTAFPECDYIIGNIIDDGEDFICPEWWVPVDPSTVEQFTGLTDVNGKEIYENDLVRLTDDLEDPIYKVIFDEAKFEIIGGGVCYDLGEEFMDCEVIGNVHENPELLEADK